MKIKRNIFVIIKKRFYTLFIRLRKHLKNQTVLKLNPKFLQFLKALSARISAFPKTVKIGTAALLLVVLSTLIFTGAKKAVVEEDDVYINSTSSDTILIGTGSTGTTVLALQQKLKEKGYYTDTVTGNYNGVTHRAVYAFQSANDLPPSGEADAVTLDLLNSSDSVSAPAADETPLPIRFGESGERVLELQRILLANGFLNHCTGRFSDETKNAVIDFQMASSIAATGEASGYTLRSLYQLRNTDTTEYPVLKTDSKGNDVKKLQQALADLSLLSPDNTTGTYGNLTLGAVKAFQKQVLYEVTGIADAKTQQLLYYTVKAQELEGSAQPKYQTLKRDDQKPEVKTLQQALKKLGYFSNNITDFYGSITEQAVKDYQKYIGLKATGIADSRTQDKIYIHAEKMPGSGKNYKLLALSSESINVRRLQQGLKNLGFFSGSVTSYYGEKTMSAVKAFQKSKGIAVTGKADISTQRLLFHLSPEAEDIQVIEKLPWYGGASELFAKQTVATVIDVNTGRSFKVRRRGGSKHADCEPLTAADTKIMKSIYGGHWSWDRRAIIVVINGRYIAASMNGMPHSPDFSKTNNFAGHFCIHFLGSAIHKTGKIDARHQACVEKAYRYGYKVLD